MSAFLPTLLACALVFTLANVPVDDLRQRDSTATTTALFPTAGSAGTALARISTKRTTRIPRTWKLRRKRQLKLRTAGVVQCRRSDWRTRQVQGRRAYIRVTLTCSEPSDGRSRRVTLINRRRRVQRKTVTLPIIIGHRGAPDLYPEESVEGYDYLAGRGIPLEVDLRPLADGTLVPLHDPTLDRTTTGTGPVGSITAEEWRSLRIKPAPDGAEHGHTLTWADMVDRYGGRVVIVAELKSTAIAQQLADSVIARGLQRTVILQTWSRATARRLVDQGVRVLFLTTGMPEPARVAATGAEFIGVNVGHSGLPGYMGRLTAVGVAPVAWTPASARAARRVLRAGAAGVFSDDPAALLHFPR